MKLVFVTPAYKRVELSAIVFEQRAEAIKQLAASGIEAQSVVIADDENLDIARIFGFEVVERDNEWLGAKFNDGYEHAIKNLGATHVFPIGSDSLCDPEWIINVFRGSQDFDAEPMATTGVIASRNYTLIDPTGTRRLQLWVPVLQGVSYVIPAPYIEAAGNRPCAERINRGCDGSTWQNISRAHGGEPDVVWSECHPCDTVALQSWPQISDFDKLAVRWAVGDISDDPFTPLRQHFGPPLVYQIMSFYDKRRDAVVLQRIEDAKKEERVQRILFSIMDEFKLSTAVRKEAKPAIEAAIRRGMGVA